METPKEYYYTYYSYEEWGRGYFGSRGCKCLPEEDVKYFGSSKDKNFRPTQKIILKDDYATREEAYADEIILHDYYDVVNNPHFANRAKQTSTKFCVSREDASKNGKKSYELGLGAHGLTKEQRSEHGKKTYELGLGAHGLTKEQMSENGKKYYELGLGAHGLTKEQMSENGRKSYELGFGVHGLTKEQKSENGKKAYELGLGIHRRSREQKSEDGKRGGNKTKELGLGIHGRSREQKSEDGKKGGRKGGRKGGKISSSQKWQCTETGYITGAGPLSCYQKARGIDTSKRIRIQ
jgi:hypothetical protein